MDAELFEPPDFRSQEPRGTCGLSVVAILEKRTVSEVEVQWNNCLGTYQGFANSKDVERLLTELGYRFTRKKGLKARDFPKSENDLILRIQWLQNDGTEYFWRAAPLHTHYVLVRGDFIFCNGIGWFKRYSEEALDYFKFGYISSYLEISPA